MQLTALLSRVMKLTAFILLVFCLQVSATVSSQTITYSGKNVPLEKVFSAIEQQTGYSIAANAKLLKAARLVSIDAEQEPLESFLQRLLDSEQLQFVIRNKTIVVSKKIIEKAPEKKEEKKEASVALPPITGVVKDSTGAPLSGASVKVKGTQRGTNTNSRGEFTVEANTGDILVISFVGFQDQEVRASESNMLIVLRAVNKALDEVQIIAYGQTTQRLSTGNISTVTAKDIAKQPVQNPLLALQGRVPGLVIQQATGMPGSGVTVRIQGQNSLSGGNDPFYVIDGVPYTSQMLPTLTNVQGLSGNTAPTPVGAGNPLSFINPSDIESITILKDADATSIYGSRAANGAILITTKKGVAGQTSVNVDFQQGYSEVPQKLKLLNTQQYLELRHEAKRNSNEEVFPTDYDINGVWDTTRYTDWQKELLGGKAHYTNAQVSISGGNPNTRFLINAAYNRQGTVFPGHFSDNKGSVRFSLDHRSSNQKFGLSFTSSYLADNNKLSGHDLAKDAVQLAPTAPALYEANGNLNWQPDFNGTSSWVNPLSYFYNPYQNNTSNLLSNLVLSYKFLKGLELKTSVGYNLLKSNEKLLTFLESYTPEEREFAVRVNSKNNSDIQSYIIEPQLHYNRVLGLHKISGLIGGTYQQVDKESLYLYGYGYTNDQSIRDLHAAPFNGVEMAINSVYKYTAAYFRLNYSFADKYIVNVSGRRDGSSRFGVTNRFHDFGSLGLGWILSSEGWLHDVVPWISFLKLKGSIGTTGNDQIGDYSFLSLYRVTYADQPYQGVVGYGPGGLQNNLLEWESTKKINIGMDVGFQRDRFLFSVNYYSNTSSNLLQSYNLPVLTGFDNVFSNFPATIRNYGWEFSAITQNIQQGKFRWNSTFNLTVPKNKLVAYPDLEKSTKADVLVIGEPVNLVKLYDYAGVDPQTGLYSFRKQDGSLTSAPDSRTDQTIYKSSSPTFFGGMQNSFLLGQFSLDFLWQYVNQSKFDTRGSYIGYRNFNQSTDVLGRWRHPGDNTAIFQRAASNITDEIYNANNAFYRSSGKYQNASFFRLTNLSLSFDLPQMLLNKIGMTKCTVYARGQNLLTLSGYKGPDPETGSSSSLPILRSYTFGVQIML